MWQHDERTAIGEPEQELAQFEPDPDGVGDLGTSPPSSAHDDPQWIVWDDPAGEADWVAGELTQIPGGWRT